MILLFDAYNLLYAGYHAFKGQLRDVPPDVAALFGFFNIVTARLKANITFQHVFMVFDHGRPQWRLDIWPEYKARRRAEPDDKKAVEKEIIHGQVMNAIEALYAMRDYMPWYTLRMPNTEADDLIAALAREYAGHPQQIITSDKDLRQLLVYPFTTVYSPVKGVEINPHTWSECNKFWTKGKKAGFSPTLENFIWFKVFTGESGATSDNIPGVPGWGELTAAKVFSLPHIDSDGVKLIERLRDNPEAVLQQAEVATWKSVGQKTRDNWSIVQRNWQLMALFDSPDRLPLDWQDWIGRATVPWIHEGRNMFLAWLEARVFKSIAKKIDNFDMMATRIPQ